MEKQVYINKINKSFPNINFKKVELITAGYDDDVIILDKKIVFSFPKQKLDCIKKFNKEIKILPILNKHITLSIPNFKYIPKDKTFGGYEYVAGEPLRDGVFKSLTQNEKILCAKQIAKFLNELHSFPVAIAKRNGVDLSWTEQDAREYYLNQAKTVKKALSKPDGELLEEILKSLNTKFRKVKLCVVHQDFTDDHILFDTKTKKINGIIDFGDIQISDPAIDFSKMWYYGEDFLNLVLKYYKTNDKDIKERSRRWWIYHNIGLLYLGITKKRKDYWKSAYGRLKSI